MQKFGHEPKFYCRSPGRVNIIGEHIDYCGYGVFPMAIQQDIVVAASPNSENKLNLTNFSSHVYPDYSTSTDHLKIDQSCPQWYHYFLCGFRGMTEHHKILSPTGLDVAFHGTVPPSSGLSSSSALVCAASMTTLYSNNLQMPKVELASLCAKSECYIGTEGGGMDQAIAILAESGCAKLIEFNPLRTVNVALPPGATFVVANSCVEMNKAASSHYNIRVVECRLAAQIIAKVRHLDWRKHRILADVQKSLEVPFDEMAEIVREILHEKPYQRKEICEILGITDSEFIETVLNSNTKDMEEFKLYQRAMHVYEEANRVIKFKSTCEEKVDDALSELGRLMNESHASCRDLYECSHPELDELVKVALEGGALGSRLTGAGWGGCTVSLVPSDKVNTFLDHVKRSYYQQNQRRKQMMSSGIFPTLPGGGAAIYVVVDS